MIYQVYSGGNNNGGITLNNRCNLNLVSLPIQCNHPQIGEITNQWNLHYSKA